MKKAKLKLKNIINILENELLDTNLEIESLEEIIEDKDYEIEILKGMIKKSIANEKM